MLSVKNLKQKKLNKKLFNKMIKSFCIQKSINNFNIQSFDNFKAFDYKQINTSFNIITLLRCIIMNFLVYALLFYLILDIVFCNYFVYNNKFIHFCNIN